MVEKTTIRKINSTLEVEYNVFICFASFENRCLVIPNKVKRKKFDKVIILVNKDGSELINDNCNQLKEMYSPKMVCLSVNLKDSFDVANQITKEINSLKVSNINVLLDISTFTHETLMITLRILKSSKKINSFTCVYVNASEYCPGVPLEKKWLSKGAESVRPIMGFPGMIIPSKKTHLIIIVGYEYSRAFSAISDIEPSSISLIYGSSGSSTTDKDKDANSVFMKLVENMAFEYSNIQNYQVPCSDPEEVAGFLECIYNRNADKNIIVVPMNNKISTLGVFLSTQNNENVQVCYAPAILYNENNYSSIGNDCYIYRVDKL